VFRAGGIVFLIRSFRKGEWGEIQRKKEEGARFGENLFGLNVKDTKRITTSCKRGRGSIPRMVAICQ